MKTTTMNNESKSTNNMIKLISAFLAIVLMVSIVFGTGITTAMAASVKPAKVKGVTVINKTSTSVTIKWKKAKNASGYMIYRATSKNGKYKKVATVKSGKTLSKTIKKLKIGKTYYYKVRAYKKVGKKYIYGNYSSKVKKKTVTAKVSSKPTMKLASNGVAVLSWKKLNVKDVAGYEVHASKNDSAWKLLQTIKGNVASAPVKIEKDTKYEFKVRAYSEKAGKKYCGSFGSVMTIGSNAAASASSPYDVKGFKLTIIKTSAESRIATLSWNKLSASNVLGYQIYNSENDGDWTLYNAIDKDANSKNVFLDRADKNEFKVRVVYEKDGKKCYGSFSSVVTTPGHYEKKWIVDEEAWDEQLYRWTNKYICNGCKIEFDVAHYDEFLAHREQHVLAHESSRWHSEPYQVPDGTKHHDAVGHWGQVWVND